jgi:hypothetical protein
MKLALSLVALAVSMISVPTLARDPLEPRYNVGDQLVHQVCEYLVTGEDAGQDVSLICRYAKRPVVMVFAREIDAPVSRLLKKLDFATGNHQNETLQTRLGSYLVLVCDAKEREAELKSLEENEQIRHTQLALLVINDERLGGNTGSGLHRVQAKLGTEAQLTVVLASELRVRASYAYRRGELKDKQIELILSDLAKILPKQN